MRLAETKLISWLTRPRNLWIAVFIYTLLWGLFVQTILLPLIFPSWHGGFGLLKGRDALKFHFIASDLADLIRASGWSQWQLRPEGQLVSGIAAIFYVLIAPMPWTVLPLNAVLNGLGAVSLYSTLNEITGKKPVSLISSLPFIFFPSSLLWNTQFHNENYAVPGVLLILYGWTVVLTWRGENGDQGYRPLITAGAAVALGSILLGLVRADILLGFSLLFLLAALGTGVIRVLSKTQIFGILSSLLLPAILLGIMFAGYSLTERHRPGWMDYSSLAETVWENTPGLPHVIEKQFKQIAENRNGFVVEWEESGSAIDLDVSFHKIGDIIRYLPRGLEIAFLAPFPDLWFSEGKLVAGTATRMVSAVEMLLIYLSYPGLVLFMAAYRKKLAVWAVLLVCSGMMVVYALTIPNVGALYRFRFPYLMPLICFGVAGWFRIVGERVRTGPGTDKP